MKDVCINKSHVQSCDFSLSLFVSRESCESEDAVSLPSSYPSSPTENGTENHSRPSSKSTLEENAYEDIVGKNSQQLVIDPSCSFWLFATVVTDEYENDLGKPFISYI